MPGRFIIVNPVACRQYGYSREEFLQLSIRDIVAPGKSSGIKEVAGRIRRDGEATFEDVHRRKDGTVFPVEASIHIFELHGQKVGLSFVRDMTERKQAEDALRESEEKYRSMLDAFPDAVSVVDREFRVSLANTWLLSWLRTLGFSDAIIGKPILNAFPFLSRGVLDEYRDVFSTGKTMVSEETSEIGNQENSYGDPEDSHQGAWRYRCGHSAIIRDITDRRREGPDNPVTQVPGSLFADPDTCREYRSYSR